MAVLRVLGIDPGTRVAGWGVLEGELRGEPSFVASGTLRLGGASTSLPGRLLELRRATVRLLADWSPDLVALEAAFFGKNARSALRLGEARGAVLVTGCEHGAAIRELPPALVKRRVAGAGAATKEQVARLVALRLPGAAPFCSSDESDAVAVALCAWLEEQEASLSAGEPPATIPSNRVSEQ